MAKKIIRNKKKSQTLSSPFKNYWTKQNYYILGVGLLTVVIGFILMAQGPWDNPLSLSVSPIVLLFAYIVIFPLSILYKKRNSSVEDVSGKD